MLNVTEKARELCSKGCSGNEEEPVVKRGTLITVKGDVKRFTKYGIEFEDGTSQNFSSVIYATGSISIITLNSNNTN